MGEKNLDFDRVIDRRNTRSLKYDFARERGIPEENLPLWVADMDFRVSSYIQEALERLVSYGIFGYSEVKEHYFEPLRAWLENRHGWRTEREWLVKTPGVVFALAAAIRAFTKEGEGVIIQQPVYYPFANVVKNNHRKLVISNLLLGEKDYEMDYADFEEKILKEQVKLFILCNPHNPIGKVWNKEQLEKIGDICLKHGVFVVSDEIHADFAFKRPHTVFTQIKEEYKQMSMVCTSPSKSFNLAGLQISNIFIPDKKRRSDFRAQVYATGYDEISLPALVACEAAYRHGEEWLDGVCAYIRENEAYVRAFLQDRLPRVRLMDWEGTYLIWLDFRSLGLSDKELNRKIIHEAGLWLDGGSMFGKAGEGFQRINIACPRKTLEEAMERLAAVFAE
ncbi:MAG: pyridoxal phosphate-dependent aminotransferase [Lachnospiraceae bacterium]|nr:pyridoxal phosphate-dependent aminotransferase [Lachnospiraceae bacterium]MCI7594896.1 pyridoxal phosphate-dependent aminotransferase [Lachnospiraceae bacterium]MDD7051781.1 pyridoxal phosphate-dependent aminotransferase [Lachnospiraceae bacterium]MDY3222948.1 MalY/PatB family protein [Lachnospiraceae bacterium]MDY4096459.1 MalY/PatB family protein [Lachnospiraceae bacterium]